MQALLGIRGLVIDLDGTLYLGEEPLPGVRDVLAKLRASGVPMRFVTNTTSRPASAVPEKLSAMNLDVPEREIFTEPRVAARVLRESGVRRAHFLLKDAVIADFAGITAVDHGRRGGRDRRSGCGFQL